MEEDSRAEAAEEIRQRHLALQEQRAAESRSVQAVVKAYAEGEEPLDAEHQAEILGKELIAQARSEETWRPHSTPLTTLGGHPVSARFEDECPDPVWSGMPRSEFRRYCNYLRQIADRIGLRDWAFNVKWEPYKDDDDAYAAIRVIEGQKVASVWFSKDFNHSPEEDKKKALIHELLHCHFDAIDQVFGTAASTLGNPVYSILDQNLSRVIEITVDALACELACLLPDIPEG